MLIYKHLIYKKRVNIYVKLKANRKIIDKKLQILKIFFGLYFFGMFFFVTNIKFKIAYKGAVTNESIVAIFIKKPISVEKNKKIKQVPNVKIISQKF